MADIVEKTVIVTVMGKTLLPGGLASDELMDRCSVAARVMRERQGDMMIPSGGDTGGTGVMEAEVMKHLMMDKGVPEERIVLECEAGSAPESAMFVMKMVKPEAEKNKTRLIIVTSAYLIPFTYWCFKTVAKLMKIDVEIETVAASGAYDTDNFEAFVRFYKDQKAKFYKVCEVINKFMLVEEDERRLIEEEKEEDTIDRVIERSLSTAEDICRGVEATVDIVDDALSVVSDVGSACCCCCNCLCDSDSCCD